MHAMYLIFPVNYGPWDKRKKKRVKKRKGRRMLTWATSRYHLGSGAGMLHKAFSWHSWIVSLSPCYTWRNGIIELKNNWIKITLLTTQDWPTHNYVFSVCHTPLWVRGKVKLVLSPVKKNIQLVNFWGTRHRNVLASFNVLVKGLERIRI